MTAVEIERRKPVWSALSEFYLDTELSKEEISRIAKVFSESKFSFEELKEINYSEVGPVVITNLYSTAGVWNGFDKEWLFEQIIKRLNKKKGKGLLAKMFRPVYRKQIDKFCSDYWQAVTTEMKNHVV
ncbi:DUF7079 family protein [Pontibacter pudoricolor]|uniref:DUF7079 family protein n=1 Tax=Pontibacter pudoricolor TaxID=2694930 RepID=UPI00139191B8|nr:hypothetical protein [Pontibacter pudoricolor]